MARLWRGARFGVFRASEQPGADEIGRGAVSVGGDVRVEVRDEPPGRVAETLLCGLD